MTLAGELMKMSGAFVESAGLGLDALPEELLIPRGRGEVASPARFMSGGGGRGAERRVRANA